MSRADKERSQSAIEFLSTYSFVFLIIAIVIVLLFALSYVPKKTLPFQCSTYGGFSCSDAAFAANSVTSNSVLKVIVTDTQPGVVSIGGFNAKINGIATVTGYCYPAVAQPGNTVTCQTSFSTVAAVGNVYYGTFNITANYCANGVGNVSNTLCPSGNSYIYGGSLVVQAQS